MTNIIILCLANYFRLLKIDLDTLASTADNGSSNKYISASSYNALAKLNLAFYPPDKVSPFSPIIVLSPFSIL